MSEYVKLEDVKELIRTEWVKYMPIELDMNVSFVLGKLSGLPTINVIEHIVNVSPPIEVPPEDAISRKAVNEMLMDSWVDGFEYQGDLFRDLAKIPSVVAKPKEGEWKLIDHLWECGCCQYRQNKSKPTNYCPNCGAKMRGAEDV